MTDYDSRRRAWDNIRPMSRRPGAGSGVKRERSRNGSAIYSINVGPQTEPQAPRRSTIRFNT